MLRSASFASLAAVAVLLLSACGSSSPNTTSQAAATGQKSSGIAFANCVRAHGVPNFPDPTSDSGGGLRVQQSQTAGSGASMTVNGVPVNAPAFQAAQKACQRYLPAPRPISAAQLVSLRKAALKMADCMRGHGVPNFPDPDVQAGPGGGAGVQIKISAAVGGPNPSSPAFQAAQKICMPLVQKAGGP
jgi:hypothetical protein